MKIKNSLKYFLMCALSIFIVSSASGEARARTPEKNVNLISHILNPASGTGDRKIRISYAPVENKVRKERKIRVRYNPGVEYVRQEPWTLERARRQARNAFRSLSEDKKQSRSLKYRNSAFSESGRQASLPVVRNPFPQKSAVPDSGAIYGVASWYGRKFHGRRTSNGEIYDMHKPTAAHKELPFGTIVRATNMSNGRSTVVRINDRGPFIEGRDIDLSFRAAYELGMLHKGVEKVRLDIIGKQTGPTTPPAESRAGFMR